MWLGRVPGEGASWKALRQVAMLVAAMGRFCERMLIVDGTVPAS